MSTPTLKTIELWFRRFLVSFVGKLITKKKKTTYRKNFSTAKYLFIRQDRIGDVLVSTPLFSLLKKQYPNAIIDVFLSTNNHFTLLNNHNIRKRWIYTKNIFETIKLIKDIRKERYDFAIDLIDNPSATSTLLCLLVGARTTVGLEKENSYAYDICIPLLSRREVHIVERLAQLLTAFDIHPVPEQLVIEYKTLPESKLFASKYYQAYDLCTKHKIGINISAGSDTRFWGVNNFVHLINYLHMNYQGYAIIVLNSPQHRNYAEQIKALAPAVFLSPITSTFDQYAALIEQLDFLITPDTAAVHLAAAFGIPSVVLYIQLNPELRIWEPYRTPCEVLITQYDDIKTISPNQVEEAFDRLVQRTKH
ncbi:MAG: glycosyltransferase family 9 protein [Bacteroidetes bacterium]|nr:glycosyltransferase family 9 protein [Bacteroidota bacterium]